MTIRIVTDSTCDLPESIIQQYDISLIRIPVIIDSREYRDGVDITRAEFYERLPGLRPAPTTAAPGLGEFRRVYEDLASRGARQILSIHVSSTLSAVFNIASQAAREVTSAAVTVFDSMQLSLGVGFLALSAAQAAAQGLGLDAILALLRDQVQRTRIFAVLDTLEYLRRGGRVRSVVAALSNLLQIKPFIKMYNGVVTSERVRTYRAARERLIALLASHHPFERVGILHAHVAEKTRTLLADARALLPDTEIWVEELNPVVGAHLGPGAIGFATVSARI